MLPRKPLLIPREKLVNPEKTPEPESISTRLRSPKAKLQIRNQIKPWKRTEKNNFGLGTGEIIVTEAVKPYFDLWYDLNLPKYRSLSGFSVKRAVKMVEGLISGNTFSRIPKYSKKYQSTTVDIDSWSTLLKRFLRLRNDSRFYPEDKTNIKGVSIDRFIYDDFTKFSYLIHCVENEPRKIDPLKSDTSPDLTMIAKLSIAKYFEIEYMELLQFFRASEFVKFKNEIYGMYTETVESINVTDRSFKAFLSEYIGCLTEIMPDKSRVLSLSSPLPLLSCDRIRLRIKSILTGRGYFRNHCRSPIPTKIPIARRPIGYHPETGDPLFTED